MTQTLEALDNAIRRWATAPGPAETFILPYPPEYELSIATRIPTLRESLDGDGIGVDWVDLGDTFIEWLDSEPTLVDALLELDERKPARAVKDLGRLATDHVTRVATAVFPPEQCSRVLSNASSIATLVSFSSVLNSTATAAELKGPVVLLFPGEDDEKSLNLLGLRADTNYRTARI